ncbi:hypothetical protein [Streptomyces sp. NPDC002265]|uniref:tetratricopeptide repeat protein n=1 Tax=Streptomyces sp. NPDC002265 TaxID=3154415 RepID=UPI003330B631
MNRDDEMRDRAIERLRSRMDDIADPELRAAALGYLATLLETRSGEPGDLSQAADALRESVRLTGDPQTRGRYLYNLGVLLQTTADRTQKFSALAEAVDAYRMALPLADAEIRRDCRHNLIRAQLGLGRIADRPDLAREAFDMARAWLAEGRLEPRVESGVWDAVIWGLQEPWATLDMCLDVLDRARENSDLPGPDAVRGERFHRLSWILLRVEKLTGDAGYAAEAVRAGRSAVALLPPGPTTDPGHAEATLADALRVDGTHRRDPDVLEEAVRVSRSFLARFATGDPDHARASGRLAAALLALDQAARDDTPAREAVGHATAAAERATDPQELTGALPTLAEATHRMALTSDDPGLVDAAVDHYRQALTRPRDRRGRVAVLLNLAELFFHRAKRREATRTADLGAAIAALSESLALMPPGHPRRRQAATTLMGSYTWLLSIEDSDQVLDESIAAGESLAAWACQDLSDGLASLCLLGLIAGYRMRYERHHDRSDLSRAVEWAERAHATILDDLPDPAAFLSTLGVTMRMRYGMTGSAEDLTRSVDYGERGLSLATPGDPALPEQLAHHSANLRERFHAFGEPDDIARAVDLTRQAYDQMPQPSPVVLTHLGAALCERYQAYGDDADLNAGIEAYRDGHRAIPAQERSDDNTLVVLHNLAVAQAQRYARHGIPSDLDDAIEATEDVIARTPRTHHEYAVRLNTLIQVLSHRSALPGHKKDLDRAITYAQQAAQTSPPESAVHHTTVAALLGLFAAAGRTARNARSFDETVTLGLRIVDDGDSGNPGWAAVAHNTGLALLSRSTDCCDAEDLSKAIDILRVDAASSSASAALSALRLGEALIHRALADDDDADRAEAASVLWQLACQDTAPARIRFHAARSWLTVADRASPDLPERLDRITGLLSLSAWRGSSRAAQESWLVTHRGFPAQAARIALEADRPDIAVELMEQGRGVLWSQLLELRTDLARIADVDPQLAARMTEVRAGLDELAFLDDGPFEEPAEAEPHAPDRAETLSKALELLALGDRAGAIGLLGPLADADDPEAVAMVETFTGAMRLASEDISQAKAAFLRSMTFGAGHFAVKAARTLGDMLGGEGDFDGCATAYERALALDDGGASASWTRDALRWLAARKGRRVQAPPAIDHMILLSDPQARARAADELFRHGEDAEPLVVLDWAVREMPDIAHDTLLGALRARLGDYVGARKALESALAAPDPQAAGRAALCLGDLCVSEFTVAEARDAYQLAHDGADPQTAELARDRLAAVASAEEAAVPSDLFDFGRYVAHRQPAAQALEALTASLAAGDVRARTHYYLAEVQQRLGGFDVPRTLRRAMALAGPDETALTALCRAWLREKRGDGTESRKAYESAYRMARTSGDTEAAALAATALAESLAAAGDLDDAVAAYERAVETGHAQHSPAAAFDFALLLARHNRKPEAGQVYRQVIATGHPVQSRMAAINLRRMGENRTS